MTFPAGSVAFAAARAEDLPAAFNNARAEYQSHGPERRKQTAHRVAWAAVKRKYRNPATAGCHAKSAESTAPS